MMYMMYMMMMYVDTRGDDWIRRRGRTKSDERAPCDSRLEEVTLAGACPKQL